MSPGVPGQLPAIEQVPIFKTKQHTHNGGWEWAGLWARTLVPALKRQRQAGNL